MSVVLQPMSGADPDKVLSAQTYQSDNISQNMFSNTALKGKKEMVPPTPIPGATIQQVWNTIFADESTFLKRYHDKRKELNLEVGPWQYAADKGSGYRSVNLITIIDMPRSGTETPLEEAHRFVYVTGSDGTLTLYYQISSQTPNVTAGKSFRTEALCLLTAKDASSECTVAFWGNLKKMSFQFNAIQYIAVPRAIKEMTAAYRLHTQMMVKDLTGKDAQMAAADTAGDAADADSGAGAGMGDAGGGGGGDGEPPSMAVQGAMLLLALLVTLVLLFSMSSIRSTSMEASLISRRLTDLYTEGDGVRSHVGGGKGDNAEARVRSTLFDRLYADRDGGGGADARAPTLTEEQALVRAAREAQVQTLRYRWMEQRGAIDGLEKTVHRLWWWSVVQLLLLVVLIAKVFFL